MKTFVFLELATNPGRRKSPVITLVYSVLCKRLSLILKSFLFPAFYLQLQREAEYLILVFMEEFSHTTTRKCRKFC